MTCDIIIPVWNQLEFTRKCVRSIARNTDVPYRLILIDNASADDTRKFLEELARSSDNAVLIRNEENLGFIKAVNQGLRESTSPYICLMNNDTIATSGWLSRMIELARKRADIGCVNPQSESPGNISIDDYGAMLAKNKGYFIETNQCLGFCMLIKREVVDKVGYLDEVYDVGGFDDTDFSMRAHLAGYKCVSAKDSYVFHNWHTSFKESGNRERLVRRNEKIFFSKWGRYLRIAFPFIAVNEKDFASDMYTALGLARGWNWVHAFAGMGRDAEGFLKKLSLPEHQNVRLFRFGRNRHVFLACVLWKLIERASKGKKLFDAVLITDPNVHRALSKLRGAFKAPIHYVSRETLAIDEKNEATWKGRAEHIERAIKKESKAHEVRYHNSGMESA